MEPRIIAIAIIQITGVHDRSRFVLKPRLHVQLLHAIILGPGRGYRCQSVRDCVTSYQKMSSDEELLLLSAGASAATISLVAFSILVKEKESVLNVRWNSAAR